MENWYLFVALCLNKPPLKGSMVICQYPQVLSSINWCLLDHHFIIFMEIWQQSVNMYVEIELEVKMSWLAELQKRIVILHSTTSFFNNPSCKRSRHADCHVAHFTLSSPELMIFLACGWDHELCAHLIFCVCAEYLFHIFNQSDLPDLMGSLWIVDFWCWTRPELLIPAIGHKDREFWGQECTFQ